MTRHQIVFRLGGVLLLAGGWQLASQTSSGLLVAPPLETLAAFAGLVSDRDFFFGHFVVSLYRMAVALGLGIIIGGGLGLASGLFPGIRSLVEPLRWMLTTVPGVVIVVVFMLWFGMGDMMVISIAAAMGAPIIFVNVADATALADSGLIEMARVYRFTLKMKLIKIYAMAVAGPFFSGLVLAAAGTTRVVVLAELLGANEGIGHCLAVARTQLDTPALYALALTSMGVVGGVEFFLLRPLERRLVRKGGA